MHVSVEDDETPAGQPDKDIARYASLGLMANPFMVTSYEAEPGVGCEIAAGGNRLLSAIIARSLEESPKPLWVEKSEETPPSYCLFAVSHAERSLATDDTINVLYAYVQLFMMKKGLVRSTLGVVAERLAFRSPERTLRFYVAMALAAPDDSLASYQVLGPERLDEFVSRFSIDPDEAVEAVLGSPEIERRPEIAEEFDPRLLGLASDDEEAETAEEVDASLGDAPGTELLLEEAAEDSEDDSRAMLDYLVEYARVHVSPVIGRALRVYRERGMAAFSDELRVTKAPRKTLAKLVQFAGLRYQKVAFIYDAFESWSKIDQGLRSRLVGAMSELRWNTDGYAFPVFILLPGEAPELEEVFGQGDRMKWHFTGLLPLQEHYDEIIPEVVNNWLAAAGLPGAEPITLEDQILSDLTSASGGSLRRFIGMARAAFESASERGVSELDGQARAAAMAEGVE